VAETYSLASLAPHSGNPYAPKTVTLPDSAAQPGSQMLAMQAGTQIFCKGPDGAQKWYTIDSERSRPGGPIYLLRVGP
jgi:hypothetical protein